MSFAIVSALGSGVIAMLLAGLASACILHSRHRLPVALPNRRSLHAQPVSRVGGLAIWVGFVPIAFWHADELPGNSLWWAGWSAIFLISLRDDWQAVRPRVRLIIQLGAAIAAALAVWPMSAATGWSARAAFAAVTIGIVWSANAFNFMDGSDGLAGMMAITGFGTYAAGAMLNGVPGTPYGALAAASLGFLVVNWPPARVFMGDNGAVPLGFLAATFGFGEWARGTWPPWFPVLAFLPFFADASITLAVRALRHERLWEAHRHHYYQRLHQLGAGHSGTLMIYGALMFGTALSAVATLAIEPAAGWAVLVAWCLLFGVLFVTVEYHWRRAQT